MKKYTIMKVADKIRLSEPEIYSNPQFKEIEFRQHELTMSCDLEEAKSFMLSIMGSALQNSDKTYNFGLRCEFLAAYDTYISLGGNPNYQITCFRG